MYLLKLYISILIFLFSYASWGQADTLYQNDSISSQIFLQTKIAFIIGYQFQKNHFVEIGLGINRFGKIGYHPSSIALSLSNELKFQDDFIWGLKAGLWLGGGAAGMNLGLNLINYTNFENNTFRFRPEIGFGFNHFRIVYGYNLNLYNKNFEGINQHNFGLNILLKKRN